MLLIFLTGIDFLARYDLFSKGLIGAAYTSFLFFLIGYFALRVYNPNPTEAITKILMPMIIISFFMGFFGFGSLITGLVVLITLLASIKIYTKMPLYPWFWLVVQILAILFISGQIGPFYGHILFWLLILAYFIKGEYLIKKNKKEK